MLADRVAPAACAAVVKADGYGLGAIPVGHALIKAGCRTFFVATPGEGAALRKAIGRGATIGVLDGYLDDAVPAYRTHALAPVLSEPGQIAAWERDRPDDGRAFVHVDSGINRLGLSPADWRALAGREGIAERLGLAGVISHLACADVPEHPQNPHQLATFRAAMAALAVPLQASFANSSGIFLGRDYHFDLARPGAALYGVNPTPGRGNPMRPVVRLLGRILQVRHIDRGEAVGYGAAFIAPGPRKLATVAVGYADGLHRSASNRGHVLCQSHKAPIVGRVSMDMMTIDVSDVPDLAIRPGLAVEVIGPGHDVDAAAADAGTIGYEILTSLGRRYRRRYHRDGAFADEPGA